MKVTLRQKELKNGNTSLYLDIYDNGVRKYEYLNLYLIPEKDESSRDQNRKTLEMAQQINADRIINSNSSIQTDQQSKSDSSSDKSPLVTAWIQTYIDIIDNDENFSHSTVRQTRYLYKLMDLFLVTKRNPSLLLEDFDKSWFIKFFQWLKDEYVPAKFKHKKVIHLCASTLRNIQQRIVAVFNKAVRDGILQSNPYNRLDKENIFVKPKTSHREILTPHELKRFMDYEEKSPGVVESKKGFVFACLTGLRISDIRALKWSDIKTNEDSMILIIVQQKTKALNAVPIGDTAKQWMPEKSDDDYVFHLPSNSCVYDNIRRTAKNAGISKKISFHTSRHTFGTLTLAATGDLYTTQRLLGHKDIRTTAIYAEVLMEDKIKAIQNADGVFKSSKRKENKTIPKTKRTAATNRHPRKVIDLKENV